MCCVDRFAVFMGFFVVGCTVCLCLLCGWRYCVAGFAVQLAVLCIWVCFVVVCVV